MFQTNPCGVEGEDESRTGGTDVVPDEPSWDWRRTHFEPSSKDRIFQTSLYGVEGRLEPVDCRPYQWSQTCTLAGLKTRLTAHPFPAGLFRASPCGVEGERRIAPQKRRHRVSDELLWGRKFCSCIV